LLESGKELKAIHGGRRVFIWDFSLESGKELKERVEQYDDYKHDQYQNLESGKELKADSIIGRQSSRIINWNPERN